MGSFRHIQIYAAASVQMLPGWDEMLPQFKPLKTKSAEENAKRKAAYDEAKEEDAQSLLHCVRAQEIHLVVYDFVSSEISSDHAVPGPKDQPKYFCVDGDQASAKALFGLQEYLEDRSLGEIEPRRVIWRSKEGPFIHRLIRIDCARDQVDLSKVDRAIYYAPTTYSWRSVTAPKTECDIDQLMKQLQITSTADSQVKADLDMTLQLYSRFGACGSIRLG